MDPETFIATGYTKHYFAGTERLASAIGNGGLADVGHPIVDGDVLADKLRERDTVLHRVMEPYPFFRICNSDVESISICNAKHTFFLAFPKKLLYLPLKKTFLP